MTGPKLVSWKQYSGFVYRGTDVLAAPPDPRLHMQRAVWLASRVEAAALGTCQSYDGCGITIGLIGLIAVDRNGRQGGAWRLLARLAQTAPEAFEPLRKRLEKRGWAVFQDGSLRAISSGQIVQGERIVEEFAGPRGVTPTFGEGNARARAWIVAFHDCLADRRTLPAQVAEAVRWMLAGDASDERAAYEAFATAKPLPGDLAALEATALPAAVDLAMAIYHAMSVNAPGIAAGDLRPLLRAQRVNVAPDVFARALVRELGTEFYGRWHDRADGKDRYDGVRLAARGSGLWPVELVDSVAPRDL